MQSLPASVRETAPPVGASQLHKTSPQRMDIRVRFQRHCYDEDYDTRVSPTAIRASDPMHPVLARIAPGQDAPLTGLARACALDELAVLEITGADAISFLQGQITNDIAGAPLGQARLAGYCTPQGRLLATLVIWRESPSQPQDVPVLHAIVRADIAAALVKRLSMFVLRAKAKLALLPIAVAGVDCKVAETAALEAVLGAKLPQLPWHVLAHPTGTWVAAPATSAHRWWCVAPQSDPQAGERLAAHLLPGSPDRWRAADIEAGLPWIEAATQDLFIPQTVNLDLIGGVSFTKGCYPGQEIVARSHYRGTLKRRMALGTLENGYTAAALPAADIFDASAPDQPCGRIVNVATADGLTRILFEATFDAVSHGRLRAASPDGPAIVLRRLPYDTQPAPRGV